ncbi:Predicted E3 ubiquitin ligase [Phaffia rhodozyma]|uniref:Predicted E3 ubiquitin ligase n=1 Tax=Phaffia rhodozyma TaxID=264483 RepID=A0A0F7SF09_PHARH|nr:Predicted E3 ubiquitin ligase [Phaffia rhodozyma]
MAECGICIEALFIHTNTFASAQAPSSSLPSSSAGGPSSGKGEPLEICSLPCGHVFHQVCFSKWFSSNGKASKRCPHCREDVTRHNPVRLRFGGDPWAAPISDGKTKLKRMVKSLKTQATDRIGIDSSGNEVETFVEGLEEVLKTLTDTKGKGREDDWLDLMEDLELKASLKSLSGNVAHLRERLHYSHRVTSLCETIAKLQADNAELLKTNQSNRENKMKALQDFKQKAVEKMDREKIRQAEKLNEKERGWRDEEKKLKLELRMKEDRLVQAIDEKRRVSRDLVDMKESLNARLAALESQNTKIADLKKKLLIQKQMISSASVENSSLGKQLSTVKTATEIADPASHFPRKRPRSYLGHNQDRTRSDGYDDPGLRFDDEGRDPMSEVSDASRTLGTSDAIEENQETERGHDLALRGQPDYRSDDQGIIYVNDSDEETEDKEDKKRKMILRMKDGQTTNGKTMEATAGMTWADDSLEVADVSWRSQIDVPVRKPAKVVYQSNSRPLAPNSINRLFRATRSFDRSSIVDPAQPLSSRAPLSRSSSLQKISSLNPTGRSNMTFSSGPIPMLPVPNKQPVNAWSFASGPRYGSTGIDERGKRSKKTDPSTMMTGLIAVGPKVTKKPSAKLL